LETIFPLLLIVLAFWLLVIRPQRKRQQEMNRIQSSVAPGSEVMLGSGIYGRVTTIGDDTLELELAPGTHVKVARQAVVRVVEPVESTDDRPALGNDGPADPGNDKI
jgi:preprotein translocase subunit YajC